MDALYDDSTIAAVRTVKNDLASLDDVMTLGERPAMDAWIQAVENRLLPRLMPDFPLVAAICGGGSSGKSTLFNALVGESISPSGGRAGINRRILIALSEAQRAVPGLADALFEPFGCPPLQMTHMDQLTSVGDPLLCYAGALPAGMALLDTPDFDTGAGGSFQNREMAERALRAADVLIYIFTNANYNNRENTDFIARMLTAVGVRKCFLIYRTYPSFTVQEVVEHAGTVARNLYGEQAEQHILGVYRIDEDNRVADGQQPMALMPVKDIQADLLDALARMDPRQIRGELHRSIFRDVIEQGQTFLHNVRESEAHLAVYLKCLRVVQQQCVRKALGHLPMDAVVRRFSQIWQETDPSHIKIMRHTGRVVETPVRMLMRAVKWIGGGNAGNHGSETGDETTAALQADLVRAASNLRKAAVDPHIVLDLPETDPAAGPLREGIRQLAQAIGAEVRPDNAGTLSVTVPAHPALASTQAALRKANWSAVLDDMMDRQETVLGLTRQLEDELRQLAVEQRSRMTAFDQIRQTFSAMLNIIPATAAVTYVLHTGDPVGAAGIKVKLAGLFGLHDLYALVAIPATAGMKKADLKQLEGLLGPVAQAWLTHKLTAIEALFETAISGPLLIRGREVAEHVADRIASMDENLARCSRALETTP